MLQVLWTSILFPVSIDDGHYKAFFEPVDLENIH